MGEWGGAMKAKPLGWLLAGLRKVARIGRERPELGERVKSHPSGFLNRRTPERCLVTRQNTNGAYYCTRETGHQGPCAAHPSESDKP